MKRNPSSRTRSVPVEIDQRIAEAYGRLHEDVYRHVIDPIEVHNYAPAFIFDLQRERRWANKGGTG